MDYYRSSSTRGDRLGVLGFCISDILAEIKPSEIDRVGRLNAINQFEDCLRTVQSLRGAVVKPFGSFVSELYTKWGDLDVSVQLGTSSGSSTSRTLKKYLLRDIMRALRRYGVASFVQFIPNARVPLLIFKSNNHSISFDVSINNQLGIIKSKNLLLISQMDERFRDMVLLTKEWAKAQNINDPKSGTLNSYSLCLLVIFHFQTCDPPILPPLREICEGDISDDTGWSLFSERHIEDVFAANTERFRSQGFCRRNRSSLAQLLVSFFDKFSHIGNLASEYAICTYTGGWEIIKNNRRWAERPHHILIEDPFELPDNAARAVALRGLPVISNAFVDAYNKLSSSAVLHDRNTLLSVLSRPSISSQLRERSQANTHRSHHTPQTRDEYSDGNATIERLANRLQNVVSLDRHSPASTSTVTVRTPGQSYRAAYTGRGYIR